MRKENDELKRENEELKTKLQFRHTTINDLRFAKRELEKRMNQN
jgi:hypothetical protein